MPELPQGTVTLLFSDIEGSTRLLARLRNRYSQALSEHQALLREAFSRYGGLEVGTEGALKVQDEVEHSVTLFIAADVPELERRLRARDTESSGEIGGRIALARHQLEQAYRFRYMVRNDEVERATEALSALIERELALVRT